MDGTRSVRMSSRRTPWGPTRSSWPIRSERVFGLMRSARGCASSAAFRFVFFGGGGLSRTRRTSLSGSLVSLITIVDVSFELPLGP